MYTFKPISDRVWDLRERVRNRVIQIDSQRARIITESYQRQEAVTPIIKRAQATHDVCSQATLWVDDEMFVGARGKFFCGGSVNPEWAGGSYPVDMVELGIYSLQDDGLYHCPPEDEVQITIAPEDYEYLASINEYWKYRRITSASNAWMPDGLEDFAACGASSLDPERKDYVLLPPGHLTPGYAKIISIGYGAIRKEAQDFLDSHRGRILGKDIDRYMFYQSAVLAADAGSVLCRRYGEECERVAHTTVDPKRRAELEMMADGLNNISENPARTYWEACQAALLYILLLHHDAQHPAVSLGRVDQYTWPFLERDLAEGRLTLDEAQEITDFFILKANQYYNAGPSFVVQITGAGNTYQHVTIGGVKPQTGEDATNPVTFMLLETIARLQLHDPTISIRINKNTPNELWDCALETSKRIGGLPLYQNDEVIIPGAMEVLGFSLQDARDYSLIGCQEIVGSGNDYPAPNGMTPPHASVRYGSCLAIALNNGVNPFSGVDTGLRTGYLKDMKNIEEVREAYRTVAAWAHNWLVTLHNYAEYLLKLNAPTAALSISIEGCMESGRDCTVGGAKYNSYGGTATGLATVADSITTIKYMVFDEKKCTAKELYDAVMANWEGYEILRQQIINEAPHYGNADPYADAEINYVLDVYTKLCAESSTVRSPICKAGLYGASDHISQGYTTWATPDGRRAGEPIADAISPAQGRDFRGPIAIFNSCNSFNQQVFMDGIALNIRLHPSVLVREDGVHKLRDMTKSYFENGGLEVQYNVMSTDTLRAAQKDPESYRNLVVRIAGYSAYFIDMNEDLQNDIIARTENMI